MLRNSKTAGDLGCFDDPGIADMRRGPYKGQELTVDHIIPRALVLELDNVIANLELLRRRKARNMVSGSAT